MSRQKVVRQTPDRMARSGALIFSCLVAVGLALHQDRWARDSCVFPGDERIGIRCDSSLEHS